MELFRLDRHESERLLDMMGCGPFLVVVLVNTMNTVKLVYRVSRLTKNNKGNASLRCSEYVGKDGNVKCLAHFDLEGSLFSSGIPAAIVNNESQIGWTADRDGDDMFKVKLNLSAEQAMGLLTALREHPEFEQPPMDEETEVSTLRGWQVHVTALDKAGIDIQKSVDQDWQNHEIVSIELVHASSPDYVAKERQVVEAQAVWDMLGIRFSAPTPKEAKTGEEARAFLQELRAGKNVSRNQQRKQRKEEREKSRESVTERLEF